MSAGSSGFLHDFVKNYQAVPDQVSVPVAGFNLTATYNTFIGPLEIAVMYNTINHKVVTGFNLEYSMNFSD